MLSLGHHHVSLSPDRLEWALCGVIIRSSSYVLVVSFFCIVIESLLRWVVVVGLYSSRVVVVSSSMASLSHRCRPVASFWVSAREEGGMGYTYHVLESKVGTHRHSIGGRDGGDSSPSLGGGHLWLVAVRGHSWPVVVRGLWHWWWAFAIGGGGLPSLSLIGVLASWVLISLKAGVNVARPD